jgi:hypothetical protein
MLSITVLDTEQGFAQRCIFYCYAECHYVVFRYAECCDYLNVMMSVVMLSVIMLYVVMLSVIILYVFMLSVIMLYVVMLSVKLSVHHLFCKNTRLKLKINTFLGSTYVTNYVLSLVF